MYILSHFTCVNKPKFGVRFVYMFLYDYLLYVNKVYILIGIYVFIIIIIDKLYQLLFCTWNIQSEEKTINCSFTSPFFSFHGLNIESGSYQYAFWAVMEYLE